MRRYRRLADRHEILERVVRDRVVEAGVDHVGAGGEQDGVAIRLGRAAIAVADVAAGAALVLDERRSAHHLLPFGGDDARYDVGRAARRVGDHDLDRPLRIGGERRADAQERRRREPERDGAARLDDAAARRRALDILGHVFSPWCNSKLPLPGHARNFAWEPQPGQLAASACNRRCRLRSSQPGRPRSRSGAAPARSGSAAGSGGSAAPRSYAAPLLRTSFRPRPTRSSRPSAAGSCRSRIR